ncbi:MAG: DNA mismatch repair protein MutL, partial [Calditrichaeota bacterium]
PSQISFEYRPLPETPPKEPDASSLQSLSRGGPAQANLWQVHNRYIFSQIKSGLVIIDQHVAHERILYEQILDYLNSGKPVPSQQLLFPQTLELSLEDYLIYDEIKEWLAKIGFVIQEMSGRTLMVEAIPAHVKVGQENRILLEMIDFYRENEGGQYQPQEKIAAAFACKNAIKSGEKLTLEEMNALVDQLFSTREPYFCPHGRPVIVTLGLDELDRKFKRI